MDSDKQRKIQELTHETNKKMDAIAKEITQLKDSDLDEKIKNDKIPAPIRNYIYILRTFFGIEVEHLIK